jgi:sporulation protein YhbH
MANHITMSAETPWYDLFSRGARDWLRHNEKVRESVQQNLPDVIAGTDLITGSQDRTVQIPVRMLEHARFRLSDSQRHRQADAGQGQGKPGDVLRPAQRGPGDDEGQGDNAEGEVRLMLELKVDDIMDWLWEELKLPDLQPRRNTTIEEDEYVREGWDKRGALARLDRRRTVKEAVKRRAVQRREDHEPVAFTNEDLRFRQLVHRRKPATNAVVIFALDVSASMTEAERKLAKTFFFFVLQGIRRRYAKVETRFIAHTTQAWEFSEHEFFQVTGTGGTGASTAFHVALDMIRTEYDPAQYNGYLFYASDGENFTEDRPAATEYLSRLGEVLNYIGYAETVPGSPRTTETEMKMICGELERKGLPIATSTLSRSEDVWKAIRKFLVQETTQSEAA